LTENKKENGVLEAKVTLMLIYLQELILKVVDMRMLLEEDLQNQWMKH
jgi:hypothetical protein